MREKHDGDVAECERHPYDDTPQGGHRSALDGLTRGESLPQGIASERLLEGCSAAIRVFAT
ncbi:MAG: hypothetical protein NTX23_09835 [Candidatus Bipolaricaulota bacterium]|nr:hypothetical protein [Candidatus Bipolaricaulota bacterium]